MDNYAFFRMKSYDLLLVYFSSLTYYSTGEFYDIPDTFGILES